MESWRTRFAIELAQDRDLPARPKPDAEEQPFFAAATFNGGPLELPDSERVAELRGEWKALQKLRCPPEPPMASAVCDGRSGRAARVPARRPSQPGRAGGEDVSGGAGRRIANRRRARQRTPGAGEMAGAPDHPLTARVMVNRIWQWHFGEALVRTPEQLGQDGRQAGEPGTAGLSGEAFCGEWLVDEIDAPHDPAVEHLSDEQRRRHGGARSRSGEPPVLAFQPAAHVGRADSRQHAGARRQPGYHHGRLASAYRQEHEARSGRL